MTDSNIRLTAAQFDQFWQELDATARGHIPEEVLQDYLHDGEFTEEIENHLADCDACQTLADRILNARAPAFLDSQRLHLLQERLLAIPEQETDRNVGLLVAALSKLADVPGHLSERLATWRGQVQQGRVQAEVVLRVLLSEGRRTLEVLSPLSHPGLESEFAGAEPGRKSVEAKSHSGIVGAENQISDTIFLTTDTMPDARVRLTDTSLELTLESLTPPLILLVSENADTPPSLPDDLQPAEGGNWTAEFRHVPSGAYLLAIAPME